jgi:transposase-like protein
MSSEFKLVCPRCSSHHIVKTVGFITKNLNINVLIAVASSLKILPKKYIDPTILDYIDKMLLEKIPLAGIARVTGVSKSGFITTLTLYTARFLSN